MKAMTQSVLVAVLISLVVALALGFLTYKIIVAGQKQSLEEECRFSLKSIGLLGSTPLPTPNIDCPYKPQSLEGTEEQLSAAIGSQLQRCWYKTFGKESKISVDIASLLAQHGFDVTRLTYRTCIVCGEFTINNPVSSNKLVSYLQTTPISNYAVTQARAGETYSEFINTDWGNTQGLITSMPTDKAGTDPLIMSPNVYSEGKLQPLPGLYPDTNYFVIKFNMGIPDELNYNHVFIMRAEDVPRLDCSFSRQRI